MLLPGSALGQPSEYRDRYAPELLFPVARADKRGEIGLHDDALPFQGEDLWNAYELSWLNPRGKPVVALGEFRFPASSPRLIESKSFKLYLNSFNQERIASPEALSDTLRRDLAAASGSDVAVRLLPLTASGQLRAFGSPSATLIDDQDIEIAEAGEPTPELLSCAGESPVCEETLCSQLLKSNCLVTGQPDWATLFIRYRGRRIDRAGLLRYIVSFRRHNEFHEQCVERIFVDLTRRCTPERLEVWARYTRRGGLDINPWRASHATTPPPNLSDPRQ